MRRLKNGGKLSLSILKIQLHWMEFRERIGKLQRYPSVRIAGMKIGKKRNFVHNVEIGFALNAVLQIEG